MERGPGGFHGSEHRDRLRLIAHLQERGFSLAAIRETLDHWTEGRSLAHLLGVSPVAPGLEHKPMRLPPEEFAARFAGVDITQEDIQRAVQIGLVELDGTELSISNETFIDLGGAVLRMGIPVSEILDEQEALTISVNGIAEWFREVFQRHFWEPFVRKGMPAEEMPSLTMAISQLTELATSVVTAELHKRFAAFAGAVPRPCRRVGRHRTRQLTPRVPSELYEPTPLTNCDGTSLCPWRDARYESKGLQPGDPWLCR